MPLNDDFSRVLDRSIAYLYRRRKRYLGEHLRPYNLTGGMHNFIIFLHLHPGQSQDALCSRYYVEKCTVSKRVKQMEALGYIRREVDENDRRQNKLFLTEKGEELVPIIVKCMDDWSRQLTEGIDEKDRDVIRHAIERMCENSEQE